MGSGDPSARPSGSPAAKGPAHWAVLQGGGPQRGGKVVPWETVLSGMESRLDP